MNKLIILFLLLSSSAFAYETGSMSCDDIGKFAASSVQGKNSGMTYKKAMSNIKTTVPSAYRIERKNLSQVINVIYKEEWAKHLSKDGAYSAFKAECQVQQ